MLSVQFSSVAQLCLTLCDFMDCSTPSLPVHHQLLELTQTHVRRVSDAIQPSYPLSSPSPPVLNLSQHQSLSNESVLHIRWPEYWSFSFSISPSNKYSGLISFRIDWLDIVLYKTKSEAMKTCLKFTCSSVTSGTYLLNQVTIFDNLENIFFAVSFFNKAKIIILC